MEINLKKRKSGVSQAINKVYVAEQVAEKSNEFCVNIARSGSAKTKAYKLAYEAYLEKGYIDQNEQGCLTNDLDQIVDTTIINIQDSQKEVVGTITLNFNHFARLPCEELFSNEVLGVCGNEASFEMTRLVIKKNHRCSKQILSQLFQSAFIFAFHAMRVKRVFIEVNPRHVKFYSKMLDFKVVGETTVSCSRVNGAPAVLLYADLGVIDAKLNDYYEGKKVDEKLGFIQNAMPFAMMNKLSQRFKRYAFLKKCFGRPLLSL